MQLNPFNELSEHFDTYILSASPVNLFNSEPKGFTIGLQLRSI